MTQLTLSKCIEIAKNNTSQAKAVKAWRLRKADKNLQQLDMPKGYIIATGSEIREILIKAGKNTYMKGDNKKGVWALYASVANFEGKVTISLAPITISCNN